MAAELALLSRQRGHRGLEHAASGSGSWKLTSATSSGIRSPRALIALIAPSARRSPPATSAVGRCGPSQQVGGGVGGARRRPRVVADPHRHALAQAGPLHRLAKPARRSLARGHVGAAADVRDPLVAVARADARRAGRMPSRLDSATRAWPLPGSKFAKNTSGRRCPKSIAAGGREQHAAGAVREQRPQRLALLRRLAVGVHHEHLVAGLLEHVLRALDGEREERERDVGDDDADERRGPRAQRTRPSGWARSRAARRRP